MVAAWLINSMEPSIGRTFLFLSLWQELDLCYDDKWECKHECLKYHKRMEGDRVYVFLAGLNRDLDEVRGRILGRNPLPSLVEVFAEVRREEGRRKIMLSSKLSPRPETSAMISKHFTPTVPNRQPLVEQNNTKTSSGTASFSKEQIDQLYKLFQSTSFSPSIPGSCSIATKGKYLQSVGFNVSTITICPWIIDSGATDHMTGSSKLFHSYIPCAGNQKIKIADGTLSAIAGQGTIVISQTITLHNVLHVPKLSCNLLSIRKLTRDLKCTTQFSSNLCVFQELDSGKTIGSAKEAGGLYYFGDESHSCGQAQQYSIAPISSSSTNEIFLLHRRMGHPNFQYLKHLYPQLFNNQNVSEFQCDIC
ncbi:hypothetical protein F511_10867 [Dorcoceras hygrometricum]|uniref:Uncharacterized protein n=1 Tax=Dorcoceras hygrometricum TaxID=472368 RepID=A0A2Z7C005_9LAMI|nr:hypothetical protein F511_10867 [Dorcoceras hygrometricum]